MDSSYTIDSVFQKGGDTFRAIFQSSNEAIMVVGHDGIIHVANPVGEKMFGYEPGELAGKSVDQLVPGHLRERHQAYRQLYNADPQPRSMGAGRDLLGQCKDGSTIPIEVSLSHTEIEGTPFVVAFIIDITKRKRTEEALRKSEEQLITYATELEQRVKRRTQDLDRTIRQLEEINQQLQKEVKVRKRAEQETRQALAKERDLNELKSRFVSMASHEFRTPLSSILSSVSLIKKYRERNDLEKIDKHTDRVRNSVKHLTDILNDFLSLGKLEEGKILLDVDWTNLREMIEDLVNDVEGILKSGQFIRIECSDKLSIYTDERLLKNILINLISNASKYSNTDEEILVSIEELGEEEVKIAVKDKGIGIPEEEQVHLFERFFRAKNVVNIQGTGLGLNIVKKYSELLQGKLGVESKLNQGTRVTIQLPKKLNTES
jgi:PAS domain S-box-containing protein